MKLYPEYKGLNLPSIDQEMLQWWEEHKIFDKSVNQRPRRQAMGIL
jgi:isoleucyl-tRNA synthetase